MWNFLKKVFYCPCCLSFFQVPFYTCLLCHSYFMLKVFLKCLMAQLSMHRWEWEPERWLEFWTQGFLTSECPFSENEQTGFLCFLVTSPHVSVTRSVQLVTREVPIIFWRENLQLSGSQLGRVRWRGHTHKWAHSHSVSLTLAFSLALSLWFRPMSEEGSSLLLRWKKRGESCLAVGPWGGYQRVWVHFI